MRKRIIAGNWKMNGLASTTEAFLEQLVETTPENDPNIERMLALPDTILGASPRFSAKNSLTLCAQNISQHDKGAFTGETSAAMLKDLGVDTSLIGHSERRQYYGENLDSVTQKLDRCFATGIRPVLCIGETLEQRQNNETEKVLKEQLEGLFKLEQKDKDFVIAYEPVWAIGTGKSASANDAQSSHRFIRGLLLEAFGKKIAEKTPILYGGSAKPSNINDLLIQPDIDGALIGGASLKVEDFGAMIKAAYK